MIKEPDHRYRLAQRIVSGVEDSDPDEWTQDLVKCLRHEKCSPEVETAYQAYLSEYSRAMLNSLILCDADPSAFTDITGLTPEHVSAYRNLFFDPGVFATRVDRLAYVNDYSGPEYAKLLYEWAISSGEDFLRWRFSGGKPKISTREIFSNIAVDSYYRFKEHTMVALSSNTGKEAKMWALLSLKASELSEKYTAGTKDDLLADLNIVLENKTHVVALGDGISEDDIVKGDE